MSKRFSVALAAVAGMTSLFADTYYWLPEKGVKADATDRERFPYHQAILSDTLPITIGGGLGQSRICMLLLQKAHIGEVQVSIWPDDMRETCKENNIHLL